MDILPEKYRKWRLCVGEVNPNDPKYTKRESELLDRSLSVLAMKVPDVCEVVAPSYAAPYDYNYNDGPRGNLTYRPNQCPERHEYHVAPAVWITPQCEACDAEFEHQVRTDPNRWSRRERE